MWQANTMKRVSLVIASVAMMTVALSAARTSAALVGYWKLNETTGTTASDSSSNSHAGTLLDGPAWDVGGVLDGAISLDGLNDRIHVPYHADLTYTGGNLTLSTWVYLNSGETSARLISKPWHGSGQYNYVLAVNGTSASFGLANAALPAVQPPPPEPQVPDYRRSVSLSTPSNTLTQGAWHHVAAVADTANNMTIYVDGSQVATRTNTITDWLSGAEWTGSDTKTVLALGTLFPYGSGWAGNTGFSLNGKLDDVALWNDALDSVKIKSIYNVPTTLGLSYDLDDMVSLWSIHDAGAGAVDSVDRIPWQYTSSLPGTPPAAGNAYTHANHMYIVLGAGTGLTSSVATNWVGNGGNNNWSTGANWDPSIDDPQGCNLYYDHGVAVDSAKLSATIDRNYTVASMRLNNLSARTDIVDPDGSRLYAFEVSAGITLTVSGAVDIGHNAVELRNRYPVTGAFSGGGEVIINGPVTIRNTGNSWNSYSGTAPATLDVSGLSRFTIDTIGDIAVGGRNVGWGELILSPDNLLKATNIFVPGSLSSTSITPTSRIHLGQQNTLNSNMILVGGRGLFGEMFFQSGLASPTVTIRDYAGTGQANMTIGDMAASARPIGGTVDFTAGTVDAQLDQLQIAIVHVGASDSQQSSPYGATGTLSMSAGTISVNDVLLGRTINGTNAARNWADGILNIQGGEFTAGSIVMGQDDAGTARARGTINLGGGTLSANTIQKGDLGTGEAVFNWTGGTLHVGTFGSIAKPIPLNQNGGTLAPGNSVGTTTVYGDYTQAATGILQIEIAGIGTGGADFDLVEVYGDTLLAGWLETSLLGGFVPELGDYFDVLHTSETLDITALQLTGDPPSPIFGWWKIDAIAGPGGEGMTLRLSAVPEPSSFLLFVFSLLSLVWSCGRWRGGKHSRLA